jgi:hypothetical protein
MRTFKVIALSCSGKGKKIYSSGDIVNEDGFPIDTVDHLVNGQFIQEIFPEKNKKSEETKEKTDPMPQKEAESKSKKK